jgi:hypothetical protein
MARLNQAFLSYIFGQHLACIALARATLEYALKSSAAHFGVVTIDATTNRGKDLEKLIKAFEDIDTVGTFVQEMHYIRKSANEVLHGAHGDSVAAFPQGRGIALRCIQNLRKVLPVILEQSHGSSTARRC